MLLSIREVLVLASFAFTAYVILLVVYRLYLSPLAKFPGPNLAAATLWYEFYYDVTLRGKYTWKIAELHKKYGMFRRLMPSHSWETFPTSYQAPSSASARMSCILMIPSISVSSAV